MTEQTQAAENELIYAGTLPGTEREIYVSPLKMKWDDAVRLAVSFTTDDKPAGSFELPSDRTLKAAFQSMASLDGLDPKGKYWTSYSFLMCSTVLRPDDENVRQVSKDKKYSVCIISR